MDVRGMDQGPTEEASQARGGCWLVHGCTSQQVRSLDRLERMKMCIRRHEADATTR
jgi:hypothetical protein